MDTYRNRPVFPFYFDRLDPIEQEISLPQNNAELAFGGPTPLPLGDDILRALDGMFNVVRENGDNPADTDQFNDLDVFMDAIQGSAKTFWAPTTLVDVDIISGSSGSQFLIIAQDYADWWNLTARQYIRFWSFTLKAHYYAQILSVVNNGDGTETVNLVESIGVTPDSTWEVSLMLHVRLTEDKIEMDMLSDAHAQCHIKFIESPLDMCTLLAPIVDTKVYLYEFTQRLARIGAATIYATSFQSPVSLLNSDGGNRVYLPQQIGHGQIVADSSKGYEPIQLKIIDFNGSPFEDWLPYNTGFPIEVVIYETRLNGGLDDALNLQADPPGTAIFFGVVKNVAREDRELTVTIAHFTEYINREIPAKTVGILCPHQLFDEHSCRAIKENFQFNATVNAFDPGGYSITLDCADFSGKNALYFVRGSIEWYTGPIATLRTIADVVMVSATTFTFYLTTPISLDAIAVGEPMQVYPGCNRLPPGNASLLVSVPNYLNNTVLFTAVAAGVAGNAVTIEYINPGTNHGLTISVVGNAIAITLAFTTGSVTLVPGSGEIYGQVVSNNVYTTANDIVALIKATPAAAALVTAALDYGTDGSGPVAAFAATNLDGGNSSDCVNKFFTIVDSVKFDNFVNFGGMPFIPQDNPFIIAIILTQPNGKK